MTILPETTQGTRRYGAAPFPDPLGQRDSGNDAEADPGPDERGEIGIDEFVE